MKLNGFSPPPIDQTALEKSHSAVILFVVSSCALWEWVKRGSEKGIRGRKQEGRWN
jgi:hypothetical protein